MTKFFFVRHGKTEWNLEGRYQGAGGDSPLLPDSYHDFHSLAQFLLAHRVKFRAIYTSPLLRAQTTAVFLSENLNQDIPIHIEPRLREFNLGIMEGKTFKEVEAKYPEAVDDFRHHPDQFEHNRVHAETFTQLIIRMRKIILDITRRYPNDDDNILIVSHGAALTALIQSLLETPLPDLRKQGGLTNTSLTIVQTKDHGQHFEKVLWNETSYLGKKLGKTDTI